MSIYFSPSHAISVPMVLRRSESPYVPTLISLLFLYSVLFCLLVVLHNHGDEP